MFTVNFLSRNQSVLLIGENIKLLRSMYFLLEVAGLKAMIASTTEDAQTILNNLTPDVIVCDVDMQQSDGYAFLRALRQDDCCRQMPFIVTSAHYAFHDLMYALDLGAADYLPKPFDTYDLMDAIKQALEQHETVYAVAS
jgi:DNA-binding NtrC family response regulator